MNSNFCTATYQDYKICEQLEKITHQQSSLLQSINKIRLSLDFSTILEVATQEVRKLFNAESVIICRVESSNNFLHQCGILAEDSLAKFESLVSHLNLNLTQIEPYVSQSNPLEEESVLAENSQIYVCRENCENLNDKNHLQANYQAKAGLIVSLIQNNSTWGFLCVYQYSQTRNWLKDEIENISYIASHLNTAIAQAEAFQTVQNQLAHLERIIATQSNQIVQDEARFLKLSETEAKLQEKEQFLRSIYDGVEHLIFVTDILENGEYRLAGWNLPVEHAVGLSGTQVAGKTLEEVFDSEQAKSIKQDYQQCLDADNSVVYEECRILKGEETWWLTTLNPLRNIQGRIYRLVGTTFNISDRKQAEKELRDSENQIRQQAQQLEEALRELQWTQTQMIQNEKMSSLGQMVAGVAHEINNPVNFIYGNIIYINESMQDLLELVDLYQKYYPEPILEIIAKTEDIDLEFFQEDLSKTINSMMLGTKRIKEIVKSLRTFSRLDEAECKTADVHEGIDSTLMILQNRLKASAECPEIQVLKNYGDLPLIECYAGQLNQVFMNIITNSIDALEEQNVKRAFKDIRQNPNIISIVTEMLERENVVQIKIFDNGTGIPKNIQNRIFDPFFTTKAVGKGTGLGMSISYKIITETHKGSLRCVSSPGEGTEFIIKIPVTQGIT
ncbi:MAG: PAS domain S-box protein [Scytonematopsis contorta HA4267-MV1]|jgi:PAS domain S-box-containing protein|nr:PAS domain S-box protein [Scytonematopsis contorta HA4267-MV1]